MPDTNPEPAGSSADPSDAPDDLYEPGAGPRLSRRALAAGAAAVAGVATVAYFWPRGAGNPARRRFLTPTEAGEAPKALTPLERQTLSAVQDRLLPSAPGAPGARDTNAVGYLDALMASDFLREYSRLLVRWGADAVHRAAHRQHKRAFASLTPAQQDDILRLYEKREDGIRWLNKMLAFTLEGFFGDPVHGGNVRGTAWKWIHHEPGHPSPGASQTNWRPVER